MLWFQFPCCIYPGALLPSHHFVLWFRLPLTVSQALLALVISLISSFSTFIIPPSCASSTDDSESLICLFYFLSYILYLFLDKSISLCNAISLILYYWEFCTMYFNHIPYYPFLHIFPDLPSPPCLPNIMLSFVSKYIKYSFWTTYFWICGLSPTCYQPTKIHILKEKLTFPSLVSTNC